jgi:hypothetical protein
MHELSDRSRVRKQERLTSLVNALMELPRVDSNH